MEVLFNYLIYVLNIFNTYYYFLLYINLNFNLNLNFHHKEHIKQVYNHHHQEYLNHFHISINRNQIHKFLFHLYYYNRILLHLILLLYIQLDKLNLLALLEHIQKYYLHLKKNYFLMKFLQTLHELRNH